MICVFRLEELSPNTMAQPTGWIISATVADAIREAELVGETRIAEQLGRVADDISYGKYILRENICMLVS